MKFTEKLNKTTILILGFIIGTVMILGVRFVNYEAPEEVHYHANFAVFVDGERELFSNPLIYEEISSCKLETEDKMAPSERAHLHDKVNDLVHVHDEAVTWGNFFQNIDWNIGDTYLDASGKVVINTDTSKVTYMLNGDVINSPTNKEISSKDILLVSYGSSTKEELQKQYDSIAVTAEKYNTTKDPASCSGGQDKNGLKARFEHML